MAEESAQPETGLQEAWPVLPRDVDIAVKCAPLQQVVDASSTMMLALYPKDAFDEDGKLKKDVALVITDDETAAKAADFIAFSTKALKKIDDRRREYSEPARLFTTGLNTEVRLYTTPIETNKGTVGAALLAHEKEKRRKAEEAEATAKKKREDDAIEQARLLESQGNTQAATRVVEVAASAPRRSAVRPTETRGIATGRKVGVRTSWTGSVASLTAILQAVIENKLSSDGIEISQAWLNRVATAHGKDGETIYGVLVKKNEGLG